jgi:hypothetical protein
MAFAIATQQGEATGHTPKGFGTAEGKRTAKAKFGTPKDDVQTANPGKLSSPKLAGAGFTHTVSVKTTASGAGSLRDILKNISQNGNGGHTFGIVTTDKPARHIGSWDGDGADAMAEAAMHTTKQASVGGTLLQAILTTGILEKLGFANSSYAGQPAQNGPGMKGRSQIPPFVAPPIEVKEAATSPTLAEDRKQTAQGAAWAAGATAAAHMAQGLGSAVRHSAVQKKEAGVGVGAGMSTSQYSGPLSYGPFKQTSQIPGFVSPGMTKVDPSLEPGGIKAAAAATGAMSPAAKLTTSQRVGAPKTTGFSGPSIADIAKPKGYGTVLPGAGKNAI